MRFMNNWMWIISVHDGRLLSLIRRRIHLTQNCLQCCSASWRWRPARSPWIFRRRATSRCFTPSAMASSSAPTTPSSAPSSASWKRARVWRWRHPKTSSSVPSPPSARKTPSTELFHSSRSSHSSYSSSFFFLKWFLVFVFGFIFIFIFPECLFHVHFHIFWASLSIPLLLFSFLRVSFTWCNQLCSAAHCSDPARTFCRSVERTNM